MKAKCIKMQETEWNKNYYINNYTFFACKKNDSQKEDILNFLNQIYKAEESLLALKSNPKLMEKIKKDMELHPGNHNFSVSLLSNYIAVCNTVLGQLMHCQNEDYLETLCNKTISLTNDNFNKAIAAEHVNAPLLTNAILNMSLTISKYIPDEDTK